MGNEESRPLHLGLKESQDESPRGSSLLLGDPSQRPHCEDAGLDATCSASSTGPPRSESGAMNIQRADTSDVFAWSQSEIGGSGTELKQDVSFEEQYFDRFDRNRDERLSLDELRALLHAVCDVWQVEPPEDSVIVPAFDRNRTSSSNELSRTGFTNVAVELLAHIRSLHPGIALNIPSVSAALATRHRAARRALLHAPLPTGEASLQALGASGVSVVLSEVRGLPCGNLDGGVLGRESYICCDVLVRRRGRLLPVRSVHCTATLSRSLAGQRGEPRWRFDEELVFDDAALLARRGDLQCSVIVRRRPGNFSRALLCAQGLPVPMAGEVSVPLLDATGQVQGEVDLSVGWQSSPALIAKVADGVRRSVQEGCWEKARPSLEVNGTEATELVACSADKLGRTVIMLAACRQDGTAFVRDLLAMGTVARLASDTKGASAVHYATLNGSLESLAVLLGSSVPVDGLALGLGNMTPLMLASLRGNADYVRLLLGHGASADRLDSQGIPAAAWGFGGHRYLLQPYQRLEWVLEVGSPTWLGCDDYLSNDEEESEVIDEDGLLIWSPERSELVSLLIEELWRVTPPLSYNGTEEAIPTAALSKIWLPVAERAAARAPSHVLVCLFREDLQARCGGPSNYGRFITCLFDEAMRHDCETLAVRLLTEIGAARAASATLEAAVTAGMPRLACALLQIAPGTHIRQPSSALRALKLATEHGHRELMKVVLEQVPRDMPWDTWHEPAVLGGSSFGECPVCFQPLCEQPVAFYVKGAESPACAHIVCFGCSERLGGKCPLCRISFSEVRAVPDPCHDPMAWFLFASGEGGMTHVDSELCSRSSFQQDIPHATSNASWLHAQASDASHGDHGSDEANAKQVCARLSCADVERLLPATLPIDPQTLHNALPLGLWDEWDIDGDGFVSQEEFFDPQRGLLRWLLNHIQEVKRFLAAGPSPNLETEKEKWFRFAVERTTASSEDHSVSERKLQIEGNWGMATITGETLTWHHGQTVPLRVIGPRKCMMELDGDSCTGELLDDGLLHWSHGEVWKRFGSKVGLDRGDVLLAALQLTGSSSLDRPQVDQLREWVKLHWHEWDPAASGFVAFENFVRPDGLADALLEKAALTHVRRSVQRMKAHPAEAGKQVQELAQLCRRAGGWSSQSNALDDFVDGDVGGGAYAATQGYCTASSSSSSGFAPCGFSASSIVARCARRAHADSGLEADIAMYGEAFPLILATLERHPGHSQVVGWACRALVSLLIGSSDAVSQIPAENASWPNLLAVLLRGDAATGLSAKVAAATANHMNELMDNRAVIEDASAHVVRALAILCKSPAATANMMALGNTVMAATAALRLLVVCDPGSDAAEALPWILEALDLETAKPGTRAFACIVACALLCDPGAIAGHLLAWGHDIFPFWSPPRAMPSAHAHVGHEVEVCCHGGWLHGVITRAPTPEPTSPRDECWVVTCKNDTRVYSRHVWATGWRKEATVALERLRLMVLASTIRKQRRLPRAKSLRHSLLRCVIVGGLGPRAAEPRQACKYPVMKGTGGISIRVGDKVWMSSNVERAKQLQAQRHESWSEPMVFCLECPGRVVETLNSPPRIRVSHGGLGTFCWNPLVVVRTEASLMPLPFEEQHGPLVVGDEVLLCAEQEKVVPVQVGHGGWSARMAFCLGRYARVVTLNNRGDVKIDTPGCGTFLWNPAAIEPLDGGSPLVLCAHAISRLDDEGAAMLLLPALGELAACEEDSDTEHAESAFSGSEVVDEIMSALQHAAGAHSLDSSGREGVVLPTLRAYGALALLAVAVDLAAVYRVAGHTEVGSEALRALATNNTLRLPDCASPRIWKALQNSEAMQWPATDTGGVAFSEVVLGSVDIATAASRWILAFFATRHRRLLTPSPSISF